MCVTDKPNPAGSDQPDLRLHIQPGADGLRVVPFSCFQAALA
jgi:hypothetical protein